MAKKKMNTDCPLQVECGKVCNHIGSENECSYYAANARPGMSMEKWDAVENARIEKEFEEQNEKFSKELKKLDQEEKGITYISVDELYPHPDNPRKNLGDLTELADSIKSNGIFQNLTVVPGHRVTKDEWVQMNKAEGVSKENALLSYDPNEMISNGYTVIIGHRRMAAAKLAGLEKVPCVITNMGADEQFRTMVIENMQRSDLTTLEQADSFQMMLDLGDTKDMISEKTGFSKSTINKRLKLREFDRKKIEAAEARGGTLFDYMKLSEIKDEKTRNNLLDKVGTPEFLNSLQSELNAQIREEDKARVLEEVTKFAKKMKNPSDRWSNKYDRVASYRLGEKPPCKVEPPKTKDELFYVDNTWAVEVYAPSKKAKKEKKPQEQVEYERWMRETKNKLKDISDRHEQLRLNFIAGLSEGHLVREKKHLDILAMASLLFSGMEQIEFNRYYDRDLLEKKFEISYKSGSWYCASDEEKEEAEKKIKQSPTLVLLYEIVSGLESNGRPFWQENYRGGYEQHQRNTKTLNVYYEFLEKLGYEMSEEEKQSLAGTIVDEMQATAPPKPKN